MSSEDLNHERPPVTERTYFVGAQPAYVPPPQAGHSGILRWIFGLVVAFVVFGGVCLYAGMSMFRYINRLERLERGGNRFTSVNYTAPTQNGQVQAQPQNSNQPQQFYFMMGGAQPAATGGFAPQTSPMAYYPPAMPYQAQSEASDFLVRKYQDEFNQYLRERSSLTPQARPAGPAPAVSWMPEAYGHSSEAIARPYIADDIVVPAKLTLALKRSFSRNEQLERWLSDETQDIFENTQSDGNRIWTTFSAPWPRQPSPTSNMIAPPASMPNWLPDRCRCR
ncbi:MAG: hypothetical protein LIP23_08875 [Planctomycetes bacterium]|nr:hypothetical protein [Planctomycetota bacterium]